MNTRKEKTERNAEVKEERKKLFHLFRPHFTRWEKSECEKKGCERPKRVFRAMQTIAVVADECSAFGSPLMRCASLYTCTAHIAAKLKIKHDTEPHGRSVFGVAEFADFHFSYRK